MAPEIRGENATELYTEAMWAMSTLRRKENTRSGPVLSIPHPSVLTLRYPTQRVLIAPKRRPNPVFHLMEAIWMLAGRRSVEWLLQFNKNIGKFAETDGAIHGAYGYRWRRHYLGDQLWGAVNVLTADPNSRQCVISMWDADLDLDMPIFKDRPCNTHIYFRNLDGKLDMTVCNRSNDLVWGALGSNIVHMTMLHEWISEATGIDLGTYRVFTNNLHLYTELYPGLDYMQEAKYELDKVYRYTPMPLMVGNETAENFLMDCEEFVRGKCHDFRCEWFNRVAVPMYDWWHDRNDDNLNKIQAGDWRMACHSWLASK